MKITIKRYKLLNVLAASLWILDLIIVIVTMLDSHLLESELQYDFYCRIGVVLTVLVCAIIVALVAHGLQMKEERREWEALIRETAEIQGKLLQVNAELTRAKEWRSLSFALTDMEDAIWRS